MSITFSDIKVIAVSEPDYTEIERAWLYSRPNETTADRDELAKVDVPVHEFARFTVQMEIPILLREWLVSYRDHIVWARTSRVDDLTQWKVFRQGISVQPLYDLMLIDMGDHQDHFRRHLPLSYMTGMSMALSFRSAVKIYKSALLAAERSSVPAVKRMFGDFARELFDALPGSVTMIANAMKHFSADDPIGAPAAVGGTSSRVSGGFFTAELKGIPMTLRAQMARHRPLMIKDNFAALLNQVDIMACPSDTPIDVQFACTLEVAKKLVTKRNCWIAQEDLWSPVVRLINAHFDIDGSGAPMLPCSLTGACTATRDNELRKAGKDPAPPCPRFARLNGETFSAGQKHAAMDYLALRPLTRNYWEKEISNV